MKVGIEEQFAERFAIAERRIANESQRVVEDNAIESQTVPKGPISNGLEQRGQHKTSEGGADAKSTPVDFGQRVAEFNGLDLMIAIKCTYAYVF